MKGFIDSIGKKKLIIIAAAFVGFIVFLIVMMLIIHAISGSKVSYKDIENKLLSGAKSYYKKNSDLLPQSEGAETSVDDVTLTASDCMKPMGDLTSKMNGVTCTGKVIVNYVGGNYRYVPLLDCGESYKTETLVGHILNNETKVFQGQGLYDLNGESVYRGENPNNYIRFSGKNYRIVKIVDNKAMIILNEKYGRATWDDRYNVDRGRNEGINDYTVSRMKETLASVLNEDKLVSSDDKSKLSIYNLYIGKRSTTDNYNDGSIEKSVIDSNQYIGLLPLYDYFNASIDGLCQSVETKNCSNYNYLGNFDYVWWLLTADSSSSQRVFKVVDAKVETARADSQYFIRPVFMLSDSILYAGGTGTEDDPYLVK